MPPGTVQRVLRQARARVGNTVRSRLGAPYSRLFFVDDGSEWVLSWEMREVQQVAGRLGVQVGGVGSAVSIHQQSVFYATQFILRQPQRLLTTTNRIACAYFHGRRDDLEPEFRAYYEGLRRLHPHLSRVQVSNTLMRDFILESGIDSEKVFLIPIGINLSWFQYQSPESRRRARQAYNLPDSAVIVGSFQKDGVGWGEGLTPKRIKGPDVFLSTIGLLKETVPELFVLLSGPARGYVKRGLEHLGVPYRHVYPKQYPEVGTLFQALDLYLVASREEGGPKAVLESMASGVPLVTTRVGQAIDLVRHGENGWMVDVDDVEGLAHWARDILTHRESAAVRDILVQARQTAQAHAYEQQLDHWRAFLEGFVQMPGQP